MCWEDQKKARTLESKGTLATNGVDLKIPANPNRVHISIAGGLQVGDEAFISSDLYPSAAICAINGYRIVDRARIEDYGQALTGPLTVLMGFTTTSCFVTETFIMEPYKP